MDIRDSGIQDDNAAWRSTIHDQVARPFALFNFGDPDLAPWTEWDVASRSQYQANATQMKDLGTAFQALAAAGIKFKDAKQVRSFAAKQLGLADLPDFDIVDPPAATTAAAAKSSAEASHKTADAAVTKANKPEPEPAAGGAAPFGGDK